MNHIHSECQFNSPPIYKRTPLSQGYTRATVQQSQPTSGLDNMKFCKNLQQIVEISNPEWAPYWTNYKMLKVRNRSTAEGWQMKKHDTDSMSKVFIRNTVVDRTES